VTIKISQKQLKNYVSKGQSRKKLRFHLKNYDLFAAAKAARNDLLLFY